MNMILGIMLLMVAGYLIHRMIKNKKIARRNAKKELRRQERLAAMWGNR